MVEFFVCGDVVNRQYAGDPFCEEGLIEEIASADYAICNFEAPVSDSGSPQPKSGPHIAQPAGMVASLRQQGFDLLLLANNHMMDFGERALSATLNEARRHELDTLGAGSGVDEAYRPLIKTFGDTTIGLVNACEAQFGVLDINASAHQAGYAWINHSLIDKQIVELKKACDFVVVFAHAGLEHYSIPQKEWRMRYKHLCDLGADVIVGCHPHVPQGYERHNDAVIFYSLGNFYFSSMGKATGKKHASYALKLQFEKGRPVSFTPVFHHTQDGQVRLSTPEERIDLDQLNRMLEEGYQARHDAMSLEVYHNYIKGNLTNALLPFPCDGTGKGTLREMIATLLGRRKHLNKRVLQLHLIRNETYYYVMRHALELLNAQGTTPHQQ
ncbi:CapA family protein [Phytohalomonas tamaricis]|uniref:CapA family protein n=1 Tax=Phytohalomonas tamaricis TaxID=2081032 RepID=UPI000D0B3D98|nr:CapA family protein [Phytohalomonas tamaricis]